MKVLYAIQGTGNGHISRARAIIPILQSYCNIDILVSGYQKDIDLPFEVKYNMRGLSFVFGKDGGIDKWNTLLKSINNELFIESFRSCTGLLCNAGFEAPAEALFMGKKLLAIPMKGQYEQQCNAVALRELGVPTIKKFGNKKLDKIRAWVESGHKVEMDFPDNTKQMIHQIFEANPKNLIKS